MKTQADAIAILEELEKVPPTPIRGIAINVDHAMTWFKKTTFYEWDKGRYPKNIIAP